MEGEMIGVCILLGFFGILVFVVLPMAIIDATYIYPQAAENANQICQQQGYDFYERFERIGILSTTPVAIECKYVQNYQEMDIALRQTFEAARVEEED